LVNYQDYAEMHGQQNIKFVELGLFRMMGVRWMNSLREISGVMDGYVETDRQTDIQTDKLSIKN